MKKLGIIWLLSLTLINMSFCKKDIKDINGPDDVIINQQNNFVAVTAIFYNQDKSKQIGKIALVDFYDTKNYKIITDTTMYACKPRFSRDKSKILFSDAKEGWNDLGDQFMVYDMINETFQKLDYAIGINPVWNYDNSGFYFTQEPAWGYQEILFYSFSKNDVSVIKDALPPVCVYPIGINGQDKVIVFSNDMIETVQPIGYYFMDLDGNYISRINNPYLGHRVNWNDELGLFVFYNNAKPGYKISVTNLDGSYYRIYTSGQYFDDFPVWGPGGKYILFNRADDIRTTGINYKLMIIDVNSGEVREFLKPGDITGAIKYIYPDY